LYQIKLGKREEYAYNEEDKNEIIEDIRKNLKKGKSDLKEDKIPGLNVQRYKGLGEMNPDQLWETTMNPENRVLIKVSIENAVEADKVFDTLMGEEVMPRKKFIQTYAKKVENLDI